MKHYEIKLFTGNETIDLGEYDNFNVATNDFDYHLKHIQEAYDFGKLPYVILEFWINGREYNTCEYSIKIYPKK